MTVNRSTSVRNAGQCSIRNASWFDINRFTLEWSPMNAQSMRKHLAREPHDPHRGKALCVLRVQRDLQLPVTPPQAPADPPQETLCVQRVWRGITPIRSCITGATLKKNPLCAANVFKPSTIRLVFFDTTSSILEKSCISVSSVGRPSTTGHTSSSTNGLTTQRSWTYVVSVEKLSPTAPLLSCIKVPTLEKNPMNAKNIGKPLAVSQTLLITSIFTLEKSIMSAMSVGRPLTAGHTSQNTSRFSRFSGKALECSKPFARGKNSFNRPLSTMGEAFCVHWIW